MDSPSDISWIVEGLDGWIFMDDHQLCDLLMDLCVEVVAAKELEACFSHNKRNVSNTNSPPQGSPSSISKTELPSKLCSNNSFSTLPTHPPVILNFQSQVEKAAVFKSQDSHMKPKLQPSRVRPPSQTYDHIIADSKRRQQLSQRFITLSTIVPVEAGSSDKRLDKRSTVQGKGKATDKSVQKNHGSAENDKGTQRE